MPPRTHLDLGRRFGPAGEFGVRLNGVLRKGEVWPPSAPLPGGRLPASRRATWPTTSADGQIEAIVHVLGKGLNQGV